MEAFVLRQYLRTSVKKNQVGEQWRVERCSRHIYSILSFIVEAEVLFLLVAKSLWYRRITFSHNILKWIWSNNGLLHLISVPPPPPVEDLPFLLTPEDWLKLHSPLKTSIKYGFTPEELGHTPEEYWFTLKNFVKIKTSPSKNSIFFYSTPEEILSFYNLPLENSMVPQPGGADIKCSSPIPTTYSRLIWSVSR